MLEFMALILGMAVVFGVGFILGDSIGWDRCWQALTKDDSWRAGGKDQ